MSISLEQLLGACNDLLQPQRFDDYCPNGLQVEGAATIDTLVTGVTASQALLEAAVAAGAQAVLVHHGYFWKGDSSRVTGMLKRRLRLLLEHDISLLAYHLPLDALPEFGNNASLAKVLGFNVTGDLQPGREHSIGLLGELSQPMPAAALGRLISERLQREPIHIPGREDIVTRVAWCTGAAQGYIGQAVAAGADAYITGEISEQTVHIARESGIHFFAAGHHATERYGVQAVGHYLAQKTGIRHQFIDIDNPA